MSIGTERRFPPQAQARSCLQLAYFLTASRIPHAHSTNSSRDEPLAVWSEGSAIRGLPKSQRLTASVDIPDPHCVVSACCDNLCPIRAERRTQHSLRMTAERHSYG